MVESRQHIELTMTASALALGKPLWDFDVESVRKIASTIVSDDGIMQVEIEDTSTNIQVKIPETFSNTNVRVRKISLPITYTSVDGEKSIGKLTVTVPEVGFLTGINKRDVAFIAIFGLAVLVIFVAALIANRVTIIWPLLRLTDAIVATRKLGSRHKVDWTSSDEMGALAKNFNEMQEELEREENELKAAHSYTQAIYNLTPAMLYSVDREDKIIAASDYWLLATGFSRQDVIGQKFNRFLDPASHAIYEERTRAKLDGTASPGVTVKLTCADGQLIDVLIRETMTSPQGERNVSLTVMTDVSELKDAEKRNHILAITDHLTGLLNRQGFEAVLDEKILLADSKRDELACLFVDLDRFKWINDNLGHAAGDEVLRRVVELMEGEVRPTDTIARLGGDEFAILVSAPKAENVAREVAERITRNFDLPLVIDGTAVRLSASIGIAIYPLQAESAAELLQKSDMAMYARKKDGKSGIEVFSDYIAHAARVRSEMQHLIEAGLENDWFEAWLQPIINLKTGEIAGFEALMRLNHPEQGIISPGGIISVAEETGSIQEIGDRIFKQAVRHLAKISDELGLQNTYLTVNFSPLQFEQSFTLKIMADLLQAGISPSRIVVEITEAVFMHENTNVHALLNELVSQGIRIALDDFGTGYSSLSYLHRFPVDIIKIDRSFIRALGSVSEDACGKSKMLIEGINTIAHKINCTVVAEGIEEEYQRYMLSEMGIDFGQGFYFAKPMPVNELIRRCGTSKRKHMLAACENN
jgi:diguanylate cyclase (GGDEF)-like protein/PAS domain S-box-containing protein